MAAPHVAGAVAVLRGPGLSPQQTVDRLLSTARALATTSVDGAGALDLAAAVGQPPTPPPSETTPTEPATVPSGSTPSTVAAGSSPKSDSNASTPAGDLSGPTS